MTIYECDCLKRYKCNCVTTFHHCDEEYVPCPDHLPTEESWLHAKKCHKYLIAQYRKRPMKRNAALFVPTKYKCDFALHAMHHWFAQLSPEVTLSNPCRQKWFKNHVVEIYYIDFSIDHPLDCCELRHV